MEKMSMKRIAEAAAQTLFNARKHLVAGQKNNDLTASDLDATVILCASEYYIRNEFSQE
jgi:hypothetical protein